MNRTGLKETKRRKVLAQKMLNLYTAVVIVTALLLVITIADVTTNRIVSTDTRVKAVAACILILGAAIGEWVGVITDGASSSLIMLHKISKIAEFCIAPAIGISCAMAYGIVKRSRLAVTCIIIHAIFQCIAACFEWVFSIDSGNIYHREELYFIYVAAFVISSGYGFFCVIMTGKEFQTGLDSVVVLTILMIVIGVGIQFIFADIRIDYLCIAIGNMVLFSRYYKMVLQLDAVTRLLNRRCYEAAVGNISHRAVVMYFDINRFKNVNDTYGHYIGDVCLRNIADIIRDVYGKAGTCYRVGGDEFCVIMKTNQNNSEAYIETLNNQFYDAVKELQNEDRRMPDVALGYAYYNPDTTHIQDTIEEADHMLYSNKESSANNSADV